MLVSNKTLTQDSIKMLLDVVLDLDRQLRQWRDSLPVELRPPDDRLEQFHVSSPNTSPLRVVRIHASYYDLLMGVHALLAYPWMISERPDNKGSAGPALQTKLKNTQIRKSSDTMAAAARNIIIMARAFDINGSCTYAYG